MVAVNRRQRGLVGEKAKKSVGDFYRTIYGLPYILGDSDGIDCFSIIARYLEYLDRPIPKKINFKGFTLNNYADQYLQNDSVINIADEYLSSRFSEKEIHQAFIGDVLLLEYNGTRFFGIDAGNGNIVSANVQSGASVTNRTNYRVLKVWLIQ